MPQSGVPMKLLDEIEDRTAITLDAKQAQRRVWLKMRALARRGAFTSDEWKAFCEDWYAVARAVDEKHERLKEMRGDPVSLLRE